MTGQLPIRDFLPLLGGWCDRSGAWIPTGHAPWVSVFIRYRRRGGYGPGFLWRRYRRY